LALSGSQFGQSSARTMPAGHPSFGDVDLGFFVGLDAAVPFAYPRVVGA
jgi:hypothetical protein